jgi:hypothetical protein
MKVNYKNHSYKIISVYSCYLSLDYLKNKSLKLYFDKKFLVFSRNLVYIWQYSIEHFYKNIFN